MVIVQTKNTYLDYDIHIVGSMVNYGEIDTSIDSVETLYNMYPETCGYISKAIVKHQSKKEQDNNKNTVKSDHIWREEVQVLMAKQGIALDYLVKSKHTAVRIALVDCGHFHDVLWKDKEFLVRLACVRNGVALLELSQDTMDWVRQAALEKIDTLGLQIIPMRLVPKTEVCI